jgi:hypothetical protein
VKIQPPPRLSTEVPPADWCGVCTEIRSDLGELFALWVELFSDLFRVLCQTRKQTDQLEVFAATHLLLYLLENFH